MVVRKVLNRFIELLLLGRQNELHTAREIIGWWETQRITFNLVLAITGLVSGLIIICVSMASYLLFKSDFGLPDPPLFALIAVVIYAVMANVLYTGGWLLELVIHAIWPNQSNNFSERAYFYGMVFSILLTISPAVIIVIVGAIELAIKLFS